MSEKPYHRRSIRLKDYDYTQSGAYFVTICAYRRECIFGEIVDSEMQLSVFGEMVRQEWEKTGVLRKNVELDAFVIMPNHFHGIMLLMEGVMHQAPTPRQLGHPIANSLSTIIGAFKAAVTRQINRYSGTTQVIWQRNYYEHIIRNEEQLNILRAYVENNPILWHHDKLYAP